MTLGPVRVMGTGVVVMMCVEKVSCYKQFMCCICVKSSYIFSPLSTTD